MFLILLYTGNIYFFFFITNCQNIWSTHMNFTPMEIEKKTILIQNCPRKDNNNHVPEPLIIHRLLQDTFNFCDAFHAHNLIRVSRLRFSCLLSTAGIPLQAITSSFSSARENPTRELGQGRSSFFRILKIFF